MVLCGGIERMTNYEKIKNMTIEEMADLLNDFSACSRCRKNGNSCFPVSNVEQWLQSEESK